MRAKKKSKGGGVGGSNKGAAYHQVLSSASYGDSAPEMVLIDMNISSSDTTSSSSSSRRKSSSSTLHDDSYGDELPLCKSISTSAKKVAKNSNSTTGKKKKAYNLEQIVVPHHEEPAALRPRDTNCHDKSPLSSPTTSSAPSSSLGNRTLLLETTHVTNSNADNTSSAYSSSMTSFNHDDDNNSCSSGDELNHINRGAQYQALHDSLDSFAALVKPLGIESSITLIRSSSAPSSLKRSSSTPSPTLSATNRLATTTTTFYTSIRDKQGWPEQSQQQQQPGKPPLMSLLPLRVPTPPPQGSSSASPSSVRAQQQSRSPVQSPLLDEHSMRQSPKPPTPPPAPLSSAITTTTTTVAKSQQTEKVGEWTLLPPLKPTLQKPRPQQPPKMVRPPTSQPKEPQALTGQHNGQEPSPLPPCKLPLPFGKPRHLLPSRKPRQASPSADPSISSPCRKSEQPLLSSKQQQGQAATKSLTQQDHTHSSLPPPCPLPQSQPPPSSSTQELPIVLNRHGCWSWNNSTAPSPLVRRHHPEDEMDEISDIEQTKQTAADDGLLDATVAAKTTRSTKAVVTLETVNSVDEVKQQQELSRDDLRLEHSLFDTEDSPPRPTTTTAAPTAGASDATAAAVTAMVEEKFSAPDKGMKSSSKIGYTSNTKGDMASQTKSICSSSSKPALNTTNGTTAATASSFSSAAYKIIKECKANRKALAASKEKRQPVVPKKVDEPEVLLRRNSILDDSMSRGTMLSKVSFYTEDNVRYYKLSKEEREHKRSGSLPSLCATEDEVREIRNVLSTLYFDGMESICNIKKGCDAGMSITEILDEHGPLEFLVCSGSKEDDSSCVTSSDTFGSYSTATYSTTPTQRRGVMKSPIKFVGTVSASDNKGQKDDAKESIDAGVNKITKMMKSPNKFVGTVSASDTKGQESIDAGVNKIAKRAIQQHRQRIMLNRQRQQESLVLDEDDDIVKEPFQVDMSRIDTFEDSLIGWPSESGCWGKRGEKCASSPPPGSPTLDSSKEKLASITEVMNEAPADKENIGGSSKSLATTKAITTTATGSLSSPDSKSHIDLLFE